MYGQIMKVLKPGGIFACYEWCLTDKYDPNNAEHRHMKKKVEEGDGLPDIAYTWDVDKALKDVGSAPTPSVPDLLPRSSSLLRAASLTPSPRPAGSRCSTIATWRWTGDKWSPGEFLSSSACGVQSTSRHRRHSLRAVFSP